MNKELEKIRQAIINHPSNKEYTLKGIEPLYTISPKSKIIIIGQAPGIKAQNSKMTWNDLSGDKLRNWLGVTWDEFYNPDNFAQIPMDFYFPGKGKSGDLPPRKDFAPLWHPQLLSHIENIELIILIGIYSQKFYLKNAKINLTQNVLAFREFLPKFIPLPHPSPRNIGWYINNPWFEDEVIPILKQKVREILKKGE